MHGKTTIKIMSVSFRKRQIPNVTKFFSNWTALSKFDNGFRKGTGEVHIPVVTLCSLGEFRLSVIPVITLSMSADSGHLNAYVN
jgi:hypothetical protein